MVVVVLNKDDKIFEIIYNNHSYNYLAQTQIALLDIKKVVIPPKYTNYTNVYLINSTKKLIKYSTIDNHTINLVNN